MLTRILIANRGEIAVRIIRACREMGITSIAVYSEADRDCLHTHLANESVCIGPASPADSYLNIPSIIAAAEVTDAHAIHPGYGFLSESAKFASICRECNIRFIGPSAKAITLSGDKSACRQAVCAAGTPILPGSDGTVDDPKRAFEIAKEVGYPLLVKASAGGGGKGMRLARNESDLKKALDMAANEAQAAFGNGGVYLEKYIEGARHVEFQVLADEYGKMIQLGERECTIQRRHQKLIEETPCSVLTPELRAEMGEAALRAARAVEYTNAGTVEFLLSPDGTFYFIELNARIQVEHPVTEEVTGIDLVREQIRIARGEPLGYNGVAPQGAAIEARIYAENPDMNFIPSPGKIRQCRLPGGPGIRVDTHVYAGYEVPRHYDALLAKVVARGRDRNEAIARLSGALGEFETEGIDTTARFCARLIRSERFRRGDLGPDLVGEHLNGIL